jgi:hypothetical protein
LTRCATTIKISLIAVPNTIQARPRRRTNSRPRGWRGRGLRGWTCRRNGHQRLCWGFRRSRGRGLRRHHEACARPGGGTFCGRYHGHSCRRLRGHSSWNCSWRVRDTGTLDAVAALAIAIKHAQLANRTPLALRASTIAIRLLVVPNAVHTGWYGGHGCWGHSGQCCQNKKNTGREWGGGGRRRRRREREVSIHKERKICKENFSR